MKLRAPSVHPGTHAGLWAITFGLLIYFGSVLLDLGKATAFIVSLVSAGAIFLFVRLRGGPDLRG